MDFENGILSALKHIQDEDPDVISIPKALVEKMLETNERLSRESERQKEREELVCRLLASGMPAEEVSLILKIRVEEIRDIEEYNGDRIADYAKKLKARRKSREREAERRERVLSLVPDKQARN